MRILYIDVETVPRGADDLIGTPEPWAPPGWEVPERPAFQWSPPGNVKDPAKLAIREKEARDKHDAEDWISVQRADAFETWAKGSLDPLRAQIVCATAGCGVNIEQHVGPGVCTWLRGVIDDIRPTHIAGYNVGFDAGMLWAAAIQEGHYLPEIAPIHYRTGRAIGRGDHTFPELLDIMDLLPRRMKQREIAAFLGCDSDHPIRGEDVLGAYLRGEHDAIAQHNRADVVELMEIGRCALRAAGVAL